MCCVDRTSHRAGTPRSAPSLSTTSARAPNKLYNPEAKGGHLKTIMALTSSLPCIDTLAFQLSRHGLDENRNIKPAFYYSWSEPFDLDFAGRVHSNPKRSRSLPSALVAKRKETILSNANQVRLAGLKRAKDENSQETCGIVKAGVDIHSASLYTSPGHLTLSVNKYANQAHRHKETSDAVDSAEGSDDEVSGLLVNTPHKTDDLPNQVVLAEITGSTHKLIRNKSRYTGASGALKRNLDEHENTNSVKRRRRPRLDFEKMQLSRNMTVPVSKSDPSIFDEVYFRPIITFSMNE